MKIKLLLALMIAMIADLKEGRGQTPNLGTAAAFAVFTNVGPLDNLGSTVITGDIGYDEGSISGFPPGMVTGSQHGADETTSQAATDVNTAYTYLSGLTCGTTLSVGLGNGQTLTPGVYCVGGASTITGQLILDGQGDPNALFIFQIGATLTTTKFSDVILSNSAARGNVYWQVNGAVSLGDSSGFRGNIVANGAISLLEGAALAGRALTRAGAISLHTNTITLSGDVTPLPLVLLSCAVRCDHQHIVVDWSTASETNNSYYSIERSFDGSEWTAIGRVDGAGNSDTKRDYSFTYPEPFTDLAYYRLKQTDLDGKTTIYKVMSIGNCSAGPAGLTIAPNPGSGLFRLTFQGDRSKVESLSVYTAAGQRVYFSSGYQTAIDLSGQQKGVYFLHLQTASQTIIQKLVIGQ